MTLFALPDLPAGDTDDESYEGDLGVDSASEAQARSSMAGREFDELTNEFLERSGATIVERYPRVFGYRLDALVEGANGARFYVFAHGTPDRQDRAQAGLRRSDTVLKMSAKAQRLTKRACPHPMVVVTSHLPKPGTDAAFFLHEIADDLFDVVATMDDLRGGHRLGRYLNDVDRPGPFDAPWRHHGDQQLRLFPSGPGEVS